MLQQDRPVIAIMGPTASGKSAAAFALAVRFNCEIISVDSAQVYRRMDIGTAKPSSEQQERVPHHLLDIREPHEAYSAADFVADTHVAVEQVWSRGHVPLLTGGTMLYFRALLHGLSALPSADPVQRRELDALAERIGWEAMHRRLTEVDPTAAARIHPNDPQRIQRALEIYAVTGKTWTQWCELGTARAAPFFVTRFVLAPQRREWLHARIVERFDQMLAQGLVDEVARLREDSRLGLDKPAMRAVGYRQIWHYLEGSMSYSDARIRAITATRQLAKRQFTWLRRERDAVWFDSDQPGTLDALLSAVDRVIRR